MVIAMTGSVLNRAWCRLTVWGVLTLTIGVAGAQQDVQSVVEAIADPSTSGDELTAMGAQLETFDPPQVVAALVQIVEHGSGSTRSAALSWLAGEPNQTPESIAALKDAAVTGDEWHKTSVLAPLRVNPRYEAEVRDIARAVVDGYLAGEALPPIDPSEAPYRRSSIDLAALSLAFSGDPADRDRLSGLLALRPTDRGVWIALSSFGPLPAADLAIAQAVYTDDARPPALRVAAAVAAARSDPAARAFAIGRIEAGIAATEAVEWPEILSQSLGGDEAAQATSRTISSVYIPQVTMAPFLEAGDAGPLLSSAFGAENLSLAQSAGYAAARRAPGVLISDGPLHFSGDTLTALLGVVATYHPEREAEVRSIAPDLAALDAAIAAFAEEGSWGLPLGLARSSDGM
jgi:hypothetical protein